MISLRQIQEADFERVNEIFSVAFGVTPTLPIEYIANLCRTDPEGCLVAAVAGEIVGYACSHRCGRIGYIGNLAVHPTYQGKGYGRALTTAVRDHLAALCDVVGLAVEPNIGRNLQLYASCGFVPTLPGCHIRKQLPPDRSRTIPTSIRTARQLGSQASTAIKQIRAWTDEVFPGLDFTIDLGHFAQAYPDDLLVHFVDEAPTGFLAYSDWFRSDPWGAVRPGSDDIATLNTLVAALEATVSDETLQFHFHTNFTRLENVFRSRGYQVQDHKTCMVLERQAGAWPQASESLFIRPWWS